MITICWILKLIAAIILGVPCLAAFLSAIWYKDIKWAMLYLFGILIIIRLLVESETLVEILASRF